MQWYYALDGQRHGPVSAADFAQLVQGGIVRAETLVWRQGMPNWRRYADVAEEPLPSVTAEPQPLVREPGVVLASSGAPARVRYGGFWWRLLAKIIDGMIVGTVCAIILLPIMIGMAGRLATLEDGSMSDDEAARQVGALVLLQLLSFLAQTLVQLAYTYFFLRKYSATPGKMVVGLKVLRADGTPLSGGRIVGRYFAEMLSGLTLGIGYLIAAFDEEKRTLHDHLCDTRVVKVRD